MTAQIGMRSEHWDSLEESWMSALLILFPALHTEEAGEKHILRSFFQNYVTKPALQKSEEMIQFLNDLKSNPSTFRVLQHLTEREGKIVENFVSCSDKSFFKYCFLIY